jgi:hypothetical protein
MVRACSTNVRRGRGIGKCRGEENVDLYKITFPNVFVA